MELDRPSMALANASVLTSTSLLSLTPGFQTINGAIDLNHTSQDYQFAIGSRSSFTLTLTNLAANLNVSLLDSSGNVLSINGVPQTSTNSGRLPEAINTFLNAGTYTVRVFAGVPDAETSYSLNLRAAVNDHADILWQAPNQFGSVIWQMNTVSLKTVYTLYTPLDLSGYGFNTNYTADFDGDGDADLVWENANSDDVRIAQMNGLDTNGTTYFLPSTGDANWRIGAITDFDQDGDPDIVRRNPVTGQTVIWQMNGFTVSSVVALPLADGNWSINTSADFNRDGRSDLLWHNAATGQNVIWQMNGSVFSTAYSLPVTDNNWEFGDSADFDQDGDPDLLWHNAATGATVIWRLNGTSFSMFQSLPIASGNWKIESAVDFDGDLDPDILWHNAATGENVIWELNGLTFRTFHTLPTTSPSSRAALVQSSSSTAFDLAGNTPATAFNLGTLSGTGTYTDAVGTTDPSDYYRFNLTSTSNVNLWLSGLTADADLQLYRDANGNGVIDAGEEVDRSSQGGTADEVLNLRSLTAGTYFVHIAQFGGNTPYTLRLSNRSPSDLLPPEVDLGTVSGTRTVTGSVEEEDLVDIYRFTLGADSAFNLALTGMGGNADVRLVRDLNNNGIVDPGEEIARSERGNGLDEAINGRSLTAGTYFIQVYQTGIKTGYTINLSTLTPSNLLPAEIDAGILSGSRTFTDAVGNNDTADVYRFSLNATRNVSLNLTGLSADANLRLIQDLNGNRQIDGNEILAASSLTGSNPETITQVLNAGTYWVQVWQSSGETNYSLSLNASNDGAGDTLTTARDIGILSTPQTFTDFVGDTDPNDFYRFTVNGNSLFNLTLNGLTADADTQLIRDTNGNGFVDPGETIAYPWQDGTTPETLTTGLTAGTYFIRIFQYSGNTNYTLTVSASPITLPPGYDLNYGYGLVNAAAAVAQATSQTPFADVPNLGGNSWNLDLINAPEVWARGYTGQGVVVAVVDTGVDYTHPDLDANIWSNSDEIAGNGIDDDSNGFIDDVRGWDFVDDDTTPLDLDSHGTHVAGTIAAERNTVGNTGVAYSARIMPVRVLNDQGLGTWADVAAGIRYAANNGADIINLSLGGGYSSEVASAIQYATQQGSLVVIAAGNEYGSQPSFPASLANQWGVAVGAVNINRQLADFSNRAGVLPLSYVVAPGVSVYSTVLNNAYQNFSGTSMATPHVAGVAALILSANPNLTPAQVASLLTSTASLSAIA